MKTSMPRTRFRRARLSLCALAGALAAGACSKSPTPAAPQHVILISLDTLRADHLSCYDDASPARTPAIDALAQGAVRFSDCTSAAPTTLASHVSLLTGTWPHTHGIFRNGYVVHPENRMLAELLGEHGFHTAGFAGSFALTGWVEIGQGFDHWDDAFDERIRYEDPEPNQRRAAGVTDAVLAYLDERPNEERLFLFAHYFDAHHPYDPPAPFRPAEVPAQLTGEIADQRRAVDQHQSAILGAGSGLDNVIVQGLTKELVLEPDGQPRGIDHDLARLYAGEVEYMDHHLGRLFAGLKERGLWDDALILLTADHGETFWEHGDFWNHGLAVYQTTVHVPLIVKLPGQGSAVARGVDRSVSLVDVCPTVLELVDARAPSGLEGVSLVPDLIGETEERSSAVFAEATQPAQREPKELLWKGACKARMVRGGGLKYVWTPYLEIEELYDLDADPGERANLLASADAAARAEADRLRAELDQWDLEANPFPSVHFASPAMRARMKSGAGAGMTAVEMRTMLEGLGYFGGEDVEETVRSGCSD